MRSFSSLVTMPLLALFFALQSCAPDGSGAADDLSFSTDTVLFDTVFTQMGSATEVLKVYNRGNAAITISDIRLAGGASSVFRMNVNGQPGSVVNDVEIESGDSIFIFLEVTLDPNGGNSPLIHQDSVIFTVENDTRQVQLVAFGQDAVYYYPTDTTQQGLPYSEIACNTVWGPAKPIVIVGYALVNANCKLTVLPGTKVHFFNNGNLFIDANGTLEVLGDLDNPVVFSGTRLEYQYRNAPGQWERIYINSGSNGNIIRNAVIKNAIFGLQFSDPSVIGGGMPGPGHLQLENVKIQNASAIGLYTIGTNVDGYNVQVSNCGQYGVAITAGGTVNFYHSTIANYWSGSNRQFPALFINNFFTPDGTGFTGYPLNFTFNNGIVYGNVQNEFGYDSLPTSPLVFSFNNSLMKIDPETSTSNPVRYNNIIKNEDPLFEDQTRDVQDFRLKDGSPAINHGDITTVINHNGQLLFDLKGANRTMNGAPDAGAFER